MHGLFNRSLHSYLRNTFGNDFWAALAAEARIDAEGFEPILVYDDDITCRLLDIAAERLNRRRCDLLEDLGTHIVSGQDGGAFRRLLRFSGVSFLEFLRSVDHLPGWGRLALPELDLPRLEMEELGGGRFRLTCRFRLPGAGHLASGVLRAMADEYGALVLMEEVQDLPQGGERIEIDVPHWSHTPGRHFDLAG